jgi:transcriptional regulator with XRE-family HTH domain
MPPKRLHISAPRLIAYLIYCRFDMTPGALIRTAREAQGLSQAALARRLGTSQPAIARLESRRSNPTVLTLRRALEALGHDLELASAPRKASGVDETLLRRQLRLSPAERVSGFERAYRNVRGTVAAARGDVA